MPRCGPGATRTATARDRPRASPAPRSASHSRHTHSASFRGSALSSAGTMVTPQAGQIGGSSSSFTRRAARRSAGARAKSWIAAATISSSAPVSATKASSPSCTVDGAPTNERRSIAGGALLLGGRPEALDVVDRRREPSAAAAEDVRERLLRRGEEPPRLLVGVGDDRVCGDHHVRRGELLGGLELLPVGLERGQQRLGREVRGEGVRQPEQRRDLRAVEARAEDPERDVGAHARNRADALVGRRVVEVALELEDVLGKGVGSRRIPAKGVHRRQIGAGSAAEPEVDPARVECLERPELLGDHERRVVREHDPARADADRARARRDVGDHDRRRGARDPERVVMLGEPEALEAPAARRAAPARASSGAPRRPSSPRRSARGRARRAAAASSFPPCQDRRASRESCSRNVPGAAHSRTRAARFPSLGAPRFRPALSWEARPVSRG